ncbi:MAG: hypothetical protein MI747_09725 [Desulfobacterales bacterium]|nr:hypothetical protein [Desulfobacterales bacterium]
MRVPSISLYGNATYNLGSLTSNLQDANEVVSTQKRINSLCDDPIGMSQIIDLDQALGSLAQINKNVDMGKTWLDGAEAAMKGIQDQVLELKTLSSQWVNASVSASERADAVQKVEAVIEQIMDLANTQVNGSYIFSGTRNDIRPFAYDDPSNPSGVIYQGSDSPFNVKTGKIHTLDVGLVGRTTLDEQEIKVDSTNNTVVFTEDPGTGTNGKRVMKTTIPDGTYSPEELALLVRNAMNKSSQEDGYGVGYDMDYDAQTRKFSIKNDGTFDGYMETEMLWKSGETPRVDGIEGDGLLDNSIEVNVLNEAALIRHTPKPPGTAPLQLNYKGNGTWKVMNDPGYGLPLEIQGGDRTLELDLTGSGAPDIRINLESKAVAGNAVKFEINAESDDHSIGTDLGFSGDMRFYPPSSDSQVTLKRFDATNNVIDFRENNGGGLSTQLSAAIPPGEYSDMGELAKAIEKSMEDASANGADYSVSYSSQTRRFTIEDAGGTLTDLQLLWNSGTNSGIGAADALGFDTAADDIGATSHVSDDEVVLFSISAGVNDAINFKEVLPGSTSEDSNELTAIIPPGDYTSIDSMLRAVENAMEEASDEKGNRVDYHVSYSYISRKITIKEDGHTGRRLESLDLLWQNGGNSTENAAETLGFKKVDVSEAPAKSEAVSWGVFETLFDLKEYLGRNDVDGLQRTLTRLDTHYNSLTSEISDLGVKSNRIQVNKQVSVESKLTLTERKSMIEDADVVESIMKLQSIETAYQASLSTTSKILNLSLVDFL